MRRRRQWQVFTPAGWALVYLLTGVMAVALAWAVL